MSNHIRELLKGVPQKIKIEEILKYLNPKRMEDIFNDLLGNMDFNEMLSETFNFKYQV